MKKIARASFFYLSLLSISLLIQSCCTNTFTIVGSGQLEAYTLDFTKIDTVSGEFMLVNETEIKMSGIQNMGIISSTMATTCAEDYTNNIVSNDISITCNKDFTFDGNVISAGTDLSTLAELQIESTSFSGNVTVKFLTAFLDKATFEKANHVFKINMKTDNDLALENEVSVFIDL